MTCLDDMGGLWTWFVLFWVLAPVLSKILKRLNQRLDDKTREVASTLDAATATEPAADDRDDDDAPVETEGTVTAEAILTEAFPNADPATRQALEQIFGVSLPAPTTVNLDPTAEATAQETGASDEVATESPRDDSFDALERDVERAPIIEPTALETAASHPWRNSAPAQPLPLAPPYAPKTPAARTGGWHLDKKQLQDAMILGAVLRRPARNRS